MFTAETSQSAKKDDLWSDSSTAYFVSEKPLSGILSRENYKIKAQFFFDRSRLDLFSHFHGFEREDGVRVVFERQKEGLVIRVSIQSYPEQILFEDKNYFSKGNMADWTIAVNNGTSSGFRVRVWENFLNKSGILKKPVDFLTDENLIADSLLEPLIFYTKGPGLRWGMRLFRTRLIKGVRVSPRDL